MRETELRLALSILGVKDYTLLALGLSEFSLHPGTLLEVRRAIREADLGALRARAPKLLAARDRRAIERWLALVADTP